MLKIFTLKFEERIESFNDSMLTEFLAGRRVTRWEAHLIRRKRDHYWTILVECEHAGSEDPHPPPGSQGSGKGDDYRSILSEDDWPLFELLRRWRTERSGAEGVPPYIILTNMQLAKIAVTRPSSLNALQCIQGIGDAKREKYGKDILGVVTLFRKNPHGMDEGKSEGNKHDADKDGRRDDRGKHDANADGGRGEGGDQDADEDGGRGEQEELTG